MSTCEDEAFCKVSLACAIIILLIRPMAASNNDVAALPTATSAEPANDSSPTPTTTFASPGAGPLLPGVQTLSGFFLSCMTDRLQDIVGPMFPLYGTLDHGALFDNIKMIQYYQIVNEHSPRHQAVHAFDNVLVDCMNRGLRVPEEQSQALHDIVKEFLHLQWLSDAIPTSLNLAQAAFATMYVVKQPAIQTAVFFVGLHDQVVSVFKNVLEDSLVTMHLAGSLRDNLQESFFPDRRPDPIIVDENPDEQMTAVW